MKYKLKQIIYYINSIIYKTINLAIKIIIPIIVISVCSNAKAFSTVSTYRYYNASDFTQSSTAFQSILIEDHAPRMEGIGTGTLTTSFLIYTFANEYPQITSISAQTSIGIYACDIGSIQYYKDNNVQYITITPVCPLMMGNGYFRGFYFTGYFPTNTVWKGGYVISFVQEDNAQDLSQVVAQQQSTTTAIVNAAQVNHADQQAIANAIASEVQAQATQWSNFMNEDARQGDGDSSRPDEQVVDDTIDAEQDVIDTINNKLNVVQQVIVTIDDFENAFEWIWYVIDSAFHTHLILFSFLIIMLWIGLIKLILCR